MERNVEALQKRLIREANIKSEVLLYTIFDCILDGYIDKNSDLTNSNALEIISERLSQYHNQSKGLNKSTFEQTIHSNNILNQIKMFYMESDINFDSEYFKKNWPNTLDDLDAPWSFIDHMIRTRAMISKIPARREWEAHTELLNKTQLKITFLRHSIKGPDGNLTEDGKKKAEAFTYALDENGSVEIFTSDIQRSMDTGRIIAETNGITKPIVVAPILSEYPYTDEKIEELGLSGGKWLMVEEAGKLLADKVAKFTLDKIEDSKVGIKTQIVAISHVPPIMAFLGYVLAYSEGKTSIDEEVKSKLLDSFGGFVKPMEGFEITYKANDTDSVYIVFPNHNLQIPISLLRNLST